MNYIKTGWSLLPPVIAILFALKTKEVYLSLFIGVVSGVLLLGQFHLIKSIDLLYETMMNCLSQPSHIGILLFLVMLGIIVALMNKSGGSQAYGKYAKRKMKSAKQSLFATFGLGILIFIDDYFNCLTVGSVMKEVTDEFKVSRSMLAYIIDSTAAPICIIAPISSWAAAVSGYTSGDGFQLFLNTIPFNLYALLTIVMVCYVIYSDFHIGKMKEHVALANNGDVHAGCFVDEKENEVLKEGKMLDLVLPVIVLIISCMMGMIYTGGFFSGKNIIVAFSQCNAPQGLIYGSFFTLIFMFILYISRQVMNYHEFVECIPEGFKAMVPSIIILVLAWALGDIVSQQLKAGAFVYQLLKTMSIPTAIVPTCLFVVGAGLSFATGTSWGTFGILIPLATSLFPEGSSMLVISISSILAGAVCGDHISPISDTTIMASTGAKCHHLHHVSTQIPYAFIVSIACIVGYLFAGFSQNVGLTLLSAFITLGILVYSIRFYQERMNRD